MLEEWELLSAGEVTLRDMPTAPLVATGPPAAWRTLVRTAAFGWVELLAARNHAALADRSGWSVEELDTAMAPYWERYDHLAIDTDARAATHVAVADEHTPSATDGASTHGAWLLTQRLVDPDGDGEWRFVARIDLDAALAEGAPSLRLHSLGPFPL